MEGITTSPHFEDQMITPGTATLKFMSPVGSIAGFIKEHLGCSSDTKVIIISLLVAFW